MLDAPDRPTPPGPESAKTPLCLGRYAVRLACGAPDLEAAQRLRALAFSGPGSPPDRDRFDPLCQHLLIEDRRDGTLLATCRVLILPDGRGIGRSYAAQVYDLSLLGAHARTMAEIGRFCIRPGLAHDADILRLAWAGLARLVDGAGVAMLFGCASFAGTDPARYVGALALLRARFLAPEAWRPGRGAGEIVPLPATAPVDEADALRQMPPLLRSYLGLGGRVSDHAVMDRQMNTLHVFTAVDVAGIPPARARALRALAAG